MNKGQSPMEKIMEERIRKNPGKYVALVKDLSTDFSICPKEYQDLEYCLKVKGNDYLKCVDCIKLCIFCVKNHGVIVD